MRLHVWAQLGLPVSEERVDRLDVVRERVQVHDKRGGIELFSWGAYGLENRSFHVHSCLLGRLHAALPATGWQNTTRAGGASIAHLDADGTRDNIAPGHVQHHSTGEAGMKAITGATLIDGRGGPPVPDATVLVDGGSIAAAGPSDRGDRAGRRRRSSRPAD